MREFLESSMEEEEEVGRWATKAAAAGAEQDREQCPVCDSGLKVFLSFNKGFSGLLMPLLAHLWLHGMSPSSVCCTAP